MSDATKAALQAATHGLQEITTAHAKGVAEEAAAKATLDDLRHRRSVAHANPIDASEILQLIGSLELAEADHAALSKHRATLDDLVKVFTASYARADAAHSVALTHGARPAAYAAIEKSVADLAAFAAQFRTVLDLAQRAGLPTSGDGWSTRFTDVLAKAGIGPRFTK